jgi:hypothetical protein
VTVCERGRSGNLGASGPELVGAAGLGLLPGIGGGTRVGPGLSAMTSATGYGRVGFRTGSLGAGALTAGGGGRSFSVTVDEARER